MNPFDVLEAELSLLSSLTVVRGEFDLYIDPIDERGFRITATDDSPPTGWLVLIGDNGTMRILRDAEETVEFVRTLLSKRCQLREVQRRLSLLTIVEVFEDDAWLEIHRSNAYMRCCFGTLPPQVLRKNSILA